MHCVAANGAPSFVQAYVYGPVPPVASAVRAIELPLSTTPAGAPVIDTDGTPKSSAPADNGGIELCGGSVSGIGTKPAAIRAATSDPAGGPMALPTAVSSPRSE